MARRITTALLLSLAIAVVASALDKPGQFRRLGACPDMGCIFPPDRAHFIAGAKFDVRVEVHAEGTSSPDPNYTLQIQKLDQTSTTAAMADDDGDTTFRQRRFIPTATPPQDFSTYIHTQPGPQETWNFTYFKDAAQYWKARDGDTTTVTAVNVVSSAWRQVQLLDPGTYKVTLSYESQKNTEAIWTVDPAPKQRKAKNVILFIGDGMTTAMITAARLLSKPHSSGHYLQKLHLDQFPVLGHVMTHSMDSLITDSANSASAYNTGHKSSVNALGVYPDSSPDPFDDPKQELLAELLRRRSKKNGGPGGVGIVTTAEVSDATPAAVFSHTRRRDEGGRIVDQMIRGPTAVVADVYMGGGGKKFHANKGGESLNGTDYYAAYAKERGYTVVHNRTSMLAYEGHDKLLGIFHAGNMNVWLDRNVYKHNLNNPGSSPLGGDAAALDQPNLDQMVIKGLEVLNRRHREEGWFMMAEAAAVDIMMHPLDYDRALADLLELDSTVGKTKAWLKRNGLDKDTLIIVTADHGHSFDVYGSVDTQYFNSFENGQDLEKKNSIGTYEYSGWPSYNDADGDGFPDEWDVRYTLAAGTVAFPSHREDFQVNVNGVRVPAVAQGNSHHHYDEYVPNPDDSVHGGFLKTGTLKGEANNGVHSFQDVPLFAMGPGSEVFAGVMDNTEVFHKIAQALGLGGE
ncbi:MAG: alkaline phosphatase-like protein [Podila humilis]|nr:MAG: alkaline phosphatase-like protein [Podila humilis]